MEFEYLLANKVTGQFDLNIINHAFYSQDAYAKPNERINFINDDGIQKIEYNNIKK